MDSTRNEWTDAQTLAIARRLLAETSADDPRRAWAADIVAQAAERGDIEILFVGPAAQPQAA